MAELSAEEIAKYDTPVPRYTSYPTVPVWGEGTPEDRVLALSQTAQKPISLYFHIPFCHRLCDYCGCHVQVSNNFERGDDYLNLVELELGLAAEKTGNASFIQLHLGGGTPTFLQPDQLSRLMSMVRKHYQAVEGAEISIEVDPGVTTKEQLARLRDLGFNRISMGVQDFSDDIQVNIGRRQKLVDTISQYESARELGYQSINFDLMYGLPGQHEAHLVDNAKRAIDMGVDRIALFGYAHVPWMRPQQKRLELHGLPNAKSRWTMNQAARQAFLDAGYVAIGFDHFALPGDELCKAVEEGSLGRNFQGYTVLEQTDLLAFGVSAIGDVGGAFVQNPKKMSEYREALEAGILPVERFFKRSAEDDARRALIMDLMCNLKGDVRGFWQDYAGFKEREEAAIEELLKDDLVAWEGDSLHIKERGRPLMRHVAAVFDAYLQKKKGKFSQAI